MSLQHQAIYRTPDGRRLRAIADTHADPANPAWTLVPADWTGLPAQLSPDDLHRCLAVQDGKLYSVNISGGPIIQDTGWKIADLIAE
jgi:hypothetical protein